MQTGTKIRILRERRGLTPAQLGKLAGISARQVANIEARKSEPRLKTAKRIAVGLGVELMDLLSAEAI
jgi:transcriptional regulator with XRE-family HTH domain